MERAPYSTATLKALPRTAFAHRTADGVWSLRNDGVTYAQATRDANENTERAMLTAWLNATSTRAPRYTRASERAD